MNQEKIMEYVDHLANALGVAAEHVWETLVRQAIVNGVVDLTLAVVMLVAGVVVWKLINKYGDVQDWDVEWMPVGFLYVALFTVGILSLRFGISQLLNPDYYAIKELLDVIGGNK